MSKNYDIKTKSVLIASGADSSTVAIGSDVATGMKRYVTFVRLQSALPDADAAKGSKVYLCSCTGTGSVTESNENASATQKLVLMLASAATGAGVDRAVQVPTQPNTEHPLFTIAAGKALVAHRASTATVSASAHLFVQYYDE